MDTKWKKCKAAAGFLAFFLGVTLTVGGVSGIARCVCNGSDSQISLEEILEGDYINTQKFRNRISEYLYDFLGMATGKPEPGSRLFGSDYDWGYGRMEQFFEESYAGGYNGDYESLYEEFLAQHEEEIKKASWYEHESMKGDENLLYRVVYGGKILYENKAGFSKSVSTGVLPESYDFLLYFDGSRVRIFKDDREINVYGDSYYDDDSLWDVPGYQNYAAREELKKVLVYMAVRRTPEKYYDSKSMYGSGFKREVSEWYELWLEFEQKREAVFADLACLCAGLVLLLAYWALRKSKRQADKALAGLLGRIWVEAGLALWILLVFAIAAAALAAEAAGGTFADSGFRWQTAETVLRSVPFNPGCLLPLVWAVYLTALDCKNNKGKWRRGLCARLLGLYRAKQMRLPFARRIVYGCIPFTCAGLLVGAALLVLAAVQMRLWVFLSALLFAGVFWGLLFAHASRQRKVAEELELLARRMTKIREGDYGSDAVAPDSELAELALDLEEIRQGMESAVAQQISSQRMKVELVANVSHDIKTPLTSIISYVQLLKAEEGLEEHVKDYVRILDEKSQRLKGMVQDVFEVSKAASGQLTVDMETLDFGKLLRQTLADMDGQISGSAVTVKVEMPQQEVLIEGDGEKLYRVFQNLIQNALKYSLEGSRVYITLSADADAAVASIKNTSRDALDSEKDFTERFVRGDASRTDGGSGLGLSIARSFTEACGGSFQLETIADLFVVTVSFRIAGQTDR